MWDNDPIFLTLEDVLEFHAELINAFGGDAALRDSGLLESAVAQPRQVFSGEYLHDDLAAMAAAYLFHIVQNHPFADGNKRTGTHAAPVFLALNGHSIHVPVDEAEAMVVGVACGEIGKKQMGDFLRNRMGVQD